MTSVLKNEVVDHEEWLKARKMLLEKEKEHTRAGDELSAMRRALPMEEIKKDYIFRALDGSDVTLHQLFDGKDQLIVYHFMFGPDEEEGCRGCSHAGNSFPNPNHLRMKNTNFVCVSRAPVAKLAAYKERNGWQWPWYSSNGTTFNIDFYATVDESVSPGLINYRTKDEAKKSGQYWYEGEVPGYSVFFKGENNKIYHTYSTWARGGETVMPTFSLLDMTPLGRQSGQSGPAEFKLNHEY
ncbi:hypothetical protein HJFPF1_12035 [Paramyrothecium foliicola]|nr:hypothetical protein HJFPF1_12035 [Paramyrothecium foliicola]